MASCTADVGRASDASFRLMALPAELRLVIYEYTIQAALATALSHSNNQKVNILHTSSGVRREALPIFFQAADAIKLPLVQANQQKYARDRAGIGRMHQFGKKGMPTMMYRGFMAEWHMNPELEGSFEFRVLKKMVRAELAQEKTTANA